MTEEERSENTKSGRGWLGSVIGFAAGAVVGSVTALLLAPTSGEETREKIKDRMTDATDKVGDLSERSREAVEEARDRMSEAYEDAVEKTSTLINDAKGKLSKKKADEDKEDEV